MCFGEKVKFLLDNNFEFVEFEFGDLLFEV